MDAGAKWPPADHVEGGGGVRLFDVGLGDFQTGNN
jgi:hypothetical protein